jgi:hypothetical protein
MMRARSWPLGWRDYPRAERPIHFQGCLMAYSQGDIDALKAAIASGALRVKFGSGPDSREVEYRSLSDMNATLATMLAEVSPTAARPRVSVIQHSRD